MGKTSIGWTSSDDGEEEGYSFNPWWGCVEVGPDCNNCYARELAARVGKPDAWGKRGLRYLTSDKNWNKVLAWNRAAEKAGRVDRVFTASMADIFEDAMPVVDWKGCAGDQKTFDKRIGYFYKLPVRKFLSLEPLIGRLIIPTEILSEIDWMIVGGESGPKARAFEVKWAYALLQYAKRDGVPFFLKQLGSWPRGGNGIIQLPRGVQNHGHNWDEWPKELDALKVREFPEIGAGLYRLL